MLDVSTVSRDASADAGFLCDKAAVLGDTIKWTLRTVIGTPRYVTPAARVTRLDNVSEVHLNNI